MSNVSFDDKFDRLMKKSNAIYPRKSDYTTYWSYKAGQAKKFDNYEDAKAFSKNIEEIFDHESYRKAMDKYNNIRSKSEDAVIDLMKQELGFKNTKLDNQLFDLIYEIAYNKGHSSGYDRIFEELEELSDFANKIVDIVKSS